MKQIVIFISGRGSNMETILKNINNGSLKGISEVIEVFSDNPHALGLQKAQEMRVKIFSIDAKKYTKNEFNRQLLNHLKELQPDLIVLAGYMRIISKSIIKAFPNKIINIHPADTTKHQGLNGYQWAYENQLKKTKVTVHYVNEMLDKGKIIAQKEVDISQADNLKEVEEIGLRAEHELYSKVIFNLLT